MVRVLVGDNDCVETLKVLADRSKSALDLTATEACVEQDANRVRGDERSVAAGAASENAGTQFLRVSDRVSGRVRPDPETGARLANSKTIADAGGLAEPDAGAPPLGWPPTTA